MGHIPPRWLSKGLPRDFIFGRLLGVEGQEHHAYFHQHALKSCWHTAKPAMMVFIVSITRGLQVHHHSCKLRQQWLAKPRLCIISSSWPTGHVRSCLQHTVCHSWCLLSPGERSCKLRFTGFAQIANTKTRSKANSKTLPLIWLVGVFLSVVN